MTDTLRVDYVDTYGKNGFSVFNLDDVSAYHVFYVAKKQRTPELYRVHVEVKPQSKEDSARIESHDFPTFEAACAALSLGKKENP